MYFVSFKHVRPHPTTAMSDFPLTILLQKLHETLAFAAKLAQETLLLYIQVAFCLLFVPILTLQLTTPSVTGSNLWLGSNYVRRGLAADAGTRGPWLEFQLHEAITKPSGKCS